MKPSYFQNAQIEETFERQCNCESKLNQLLWNEFLIITLPLVGWSSPRLRERPCTLCLWNGRDFLPLQYITLNIQTLKLFCSPWKYSSKAIFHTNPWLISSKKWRVSFIFFLIKCIISAVGTMASESEEYSSTSTEKFTFSKVVCKCI